jgi:choline dehydrogenase-like flavoprotein
MMEYSDGVYETIRTGIKVVAGPTSAIGVKEFIRMTPRVPSALWCKFMSKRDPRYVPPWAQLKLSVWCEQSPKSDSRITLSSQKDKLGLRKANVSWVVSPLEVESIRTYTRIVKEAFADRGIAQVIPIKELYSRDITMRCSDQFHHCGGTRMAISPQEGVVDQNLRLHGIENAYLCSSSVFPTSGFANPTHTVIALAARLAHRLDGLLTKSTRTDELVLESSSVS